MYLGITILPARELNKIFIKNYFVCMCLLKNNYKHGRASLFDVKDFLTDGFIEANIVLEHVELMKTFIKKIS